MQSTSIFFRNSPTEYGWAVSGLIFISGQGTPINDSEVDREFVVSTALPGTTEPDRMLMDITLRVDESVEPPVPISVVSIGDDLGGGSEEVVGQALQELIPNIVEEQIFPLGTVSGSLMSANWGVLLVGQDGKTWVCVDVEKPYAEQVYNRLSQNKVACWLVRALRGDSVAAQYDVVKQNNC